MDFAYQLMQPLPLTVAQNPPPIQPMPYYPYAQMPLWLYQNLQHPMQVQPNYSAYIVCLPLPTIPIPEYIHTTDNASQQSQCENEMSFLSMVETLETTPMSVSYGSGERNQVSGNDDEVMDQLNQLQIAGKPESPISTTNPNGNIQWQLTNGVKVEISYHGSLLLCCDKISLTVGLNGQTLAVLHPAARLWYHREKVHLTMLTRHGHRRQVKMWHKGISFSANPLSVAYLLDIAGVRTSIDQFRIINDSTIKSTFLENPDEVEMDMPRIFIQPGLWQVGEYVIEQRHDGVTKISNESKGIEVRLCPSSGNLQVRTSFLYMTASCTSTGKGRHMYLRRIQARDDSSSRRMHFDGEHLVVRDGGQEAALDVNGRLRVERESSQESHILSL